MTNLSRENKTIKSIFEITILVLFNVDLKNLARGQHLNLLCKFYLCKFNDFAANWLVIDFDQRFILLKC